MRDKRIRHINRKVETLLQMIAQDSYGFYLDNSGSTSGSSHYWNTVNKILQLHSRQISSYFFWNSQLEVSSLKGIQFSVGKKDGRGGTNPVIVANAVIQRKHHNLILVTDGEVQSVEHCDQVLQAAKFQFKKVICYIVANGNGDVDMSVTCAFTRGCESEVYKKLKDHDMEKMISYKKEDFKMLESIQDMTLENFQELYDKLETLIIALNMGKESNIPLKNQLVMLKKRLLNEFSKRMAADNNHGDNIRDCLRNGDLKGALEHASDMTNKYFGGSINLTLEKKISHLINLCGDLRGKFNLKEIQSNRMATANQAEEGQLDLNVESHDLTEHLIECPIIMDEDVPQILVDQCEPVLLGVEKHIVDDITACPLRILNYPDIKAKLKATLSNYIGVKFGDKLLKNPFTQNRLLGSIPLGNHPSHLKVGNFTLAKLLTGGKVLGNLHLYFAAIWAIIMNDEIEYLKDVQKNVNEHLLFRLRTSQTMASLCGLGQFVNTRISTDIAVWFSVNSCALNMPTDRDTFRFHIYNIRPMVKIIQALGYPCHPNLQPHYYRTLATLNLLTRIKKMTHPQRKSFLTLVKGLYQNGVFVDHTALSQEFKQKQLCPIFIPIDGPASPEQVQRVRSMLPRDCKPLSSQQIVYIAGTLDANKAASDIFLDFNLVVPPLPPFEVKWCYGLVHFESDVKINPLTMRPQYRVNGKEWTECAKEKFKVANLQHLFKGMKYAEGFVLKHRKQPTYNELLVFYFNRYLEAGKTTTLPFLLAKWTAEIIEDYRPFFHQHHNIEDIIQTFNASRPIAQRIILEK